MVPPRSQEAERVFSQRPRARRLLAIRAFSTPNRGRFPLTYFGHSANLWWNP